MIGAAREIWRRHRVLTIATATAALATLFFLLRFVTQIVYWEAHRDAPLQDWMTIGYVARSYQVDRDALLRAAGVDPDAPPHKRLTLGEIATRRGAPVAAIEAELRAAIAAERDADDAGR